MTVSSVDKPSGRMMDAGDEYALQQLAYAAGVADAARGIHWSKSEFPPLMAAVCVEMGIGGYHEDQTERIGRAYEFGYESVAGRAN